MKSIGALGWLAIVTLVIVIALCAYAWFALSRYLHVGGIQIHKILSANRTGTVSQVMGNMTEGFNTSQFEVAYSGNAIVTLEGIQLGLPVNASMARYYNDSRAEIRIQNIPILGNLTIVQIKNGNSYYSCLGSINSSLRGYQCSVQPESNSIFYILGLASNDSAAGGLGSTQMHFGTVNQSSYSGMPCTNMDGYFSFTNSSRLGNLNLSSEAVQSPQAGNVSFLSCVSDQDRIPLTIYLYVLAKSGNTATSAGLQLGETSFSRTASGNITELPGPIMNQTD
jgi:hypothetical protein